ncbi:MAG: hypothetical protein NTW25_15965 [Candidatus Kapabacteria bacterium]|nr:hypothetical protein [Candidatus Kapabacteria bacterium]
MTEQEKLSWLNTNKIKLVINNDESHQYFHHHAFEIINSNLVLKNLFISSLSKDINVKTRIKMTKSIESPAIEASDLNNEIRKLLTKINNFEIHLEVEENNGVFYFSADKSKIAGFDFAILNTEKNLIALRNLCFGELRYKDGGKRWKKFLDNNKNNSKIVNIAEQIETIAKDGTNIYLSNDVNNEPLIVGEIQFGNWALAYRDFFKVLKADVQNSIDCLIYIVPTGKLEVMLSDGIVTFEKTKKILKDFNKVISVPVWLIGIDVE